MEQLVRDQRSRSATLENDDEGVSMLRGPRPRSPSKPNVIRDPTPQQEIIDLVEEQGPVIEEINLEEAGLFDEGAIDLTDEAYDSNIGQRLQSDEFVVTHIHHQGIKIEKGVILEVFNVQFGHWNVDFVQVDIVVQDRQAVGKIRGTPLVRTRELKGKLPKKVNEVCKVLHYHQTAPQPQHGLVEVPLGSIIRKRDMIFTNTIYPHHRSRLASKANAGNLLPLVCRWKLIVLFALVGRQLKPDEEVLVRIQSDEVTDAKYRVADETLSSEWRGFTVPGGSYRSPDTTIDLDGPRQPRSRVRGNHQKYSLFDSYAGAGGVSRGAQDAGFHVTEAVDNDPRV